MESESVGLSKHQRKAQARKAAGLCMHCPNPVKPGFNKRKEQYTKCEECLEYYAKKGRLRYQERLKENQCPKCGKPSKDGNCSECRMKSAQYDLNYIQSLAIQGRCRCGNVVESGATRCVDCKEKQNKSREAIEEARKNLGLCIKCAKPAEKQVVSDDHGEPIETALIYCKDHVEDNRRRQRRHHDAAIVRNRDRRRKLIADGKCVCGKPLEWKKKRCGECLERERVSAAIRRMRAKPRPQTVDQAKKTRHETTKVLGSLLMAITNAGGPPK